MRPLSKNPKRTPTTLRLILTYCIACTFGLIISVSAFSDSTSPVEATSDQTEITDNKKESKKDKGDKASKGDKTKVKGKKDRSFPAPENNWKVATIILGRPTDQSIAMNVYPSNLLEGYIEYGTTEANFSNKTNLRYFEANIENHIELTSLNINTQYFYRLVYRASDDSIEDENYSTGPIYKFHTQRALGSSFIFEVQGDSHPERNPKQNVPALYEQTLTAVSKDNPDFYLALGDDFSVDTLKDVNINSVEKVYLQQLPYLGLVAHSSALFLVNGNHEQAARYNLDGTKDNVAVWAQNNRNRLFPQPAPNDFYTGDTEEVPHIGLLRDYYAWTWGDALFVTIDPYWHSSVAVDNHISGDKKSKQPWAKTLGDDQYQWLKETLENSDASFKFVFAHHVNGTGRGGANIANLYEWGGESDRGKWEFDEYRPNWEMPIHQLFVENNVSIFFQGHDHVFAHEVKDGVIYQTVPEPADATETLYFEDDFKGGLVYSNTGRIRVTVNPDEVSVEYVKSQLPIDGMETEQNNKTIYQYSLERID